MPIINIMKILLSNFFLALLIIGCASAGENEAQAPSEQETAKLFALVNNKDSLALKKAINLQNANAFDSAGVNLLTRAVMTGDLNIVKILVEQGADVNLRNKTTTGSVPLMLASGNTSLEIARYLIARGAEVDIPDTHGDPAINWSAYYGNLPFTKLMLDEGARTDQRSIHSDGVLQVALKEWNDSIVDLLLAYGISFYEPKPGTEALIKAAKKNDFSAFKSLLKPEHVNARDAAGNTLLMLAAQRGYAEMTDYLLKNGADINALNPAGHTALNLAVYYGHNALAKHLIEQGADVNKTDERFVLPPLVAAVRSNNLEMGAYLLEKGADVNTTDGINNFTPIMWAVLNQYKDFARLLLEYQPDLLVVSKYGQKVFAMTKDEELLRLMNGL